MLLSSAAFTCERGIKAISADTTIHKAAKYNPSLRMVILLILRSPQPKWAGWASLTFSSRSVNLHGRISRPETQKAESPLVALTLPLAATRPSLSPLGLEPLKDPWLSVPCSRRVWPYRIFHTVADQGKGLASGGHVRGLLSGDLNEANWRPCTPAGLWMSSEITALSNKKPDGKTLPPCHLLRHVEQELALAFAPAPKELVRLAD